MLAGLLVVACCLVFDVCRMLVGADCCLMEDDCCCVFDVCRSLCVVCLARLAVCCVLDVGC